MARTAIRAGTVLDGTGARLDDATVGFEGDRIVECSSGGPTESYDTLIEYPDRTVLPGLIDAHVHLMFTGEPEDLDVTDHRDEYLSLRGAEMARRALRVGVTTVADVAARNETMFALREAVADGVTLGPRIKACGSMLSISGGRATGGRPGGTTIEVDGPTEARREARKLLMYHGADLIKLAATGALSSPHTGARDPQLTVAEMRAATEEAHKVGRPVHAHCYGERGITNALDAGVDVIVHGQSLTDDHVERMRREDVILAPTLTTYRSAEHSEADDPLDQFRDDRERPDSSAGVLAETEPNFRTALASDLPITMGTDSGMPYTRYGENTRDLAYMVDWGMDELEAITAGTLTAARSLHCGDELGSLEPGKRADLLVVDGDPSADIDCLLDPDAFERILLRGEFVEDRV